MTTHRRHRIRTRLAALGLTAATVAAGGVAAAPAAHAESVTYWRAIASGSMSILTEPSAVRGTDGNIDVVVTRTHGTGENINHLRLAPDGRVLSRQWVLPTDWSSVSEVKLLRAPGLRVVFTGMRTTNSFDPYTSQVYSASRVGSGWSLDASKLTGGCCYAWASTPAAVDVPGGPMVAYTHNSNFYSHRGPIPLSDTVSASTIDAPPGGGCCAYNGNLVRDSVTGNVYGAWYHSSTAAHGVWVKRLYPTAGPATRAPVLGTFIYPGETRIAAASRIGGGSYIGYCTSSNTYSCESIRLWKIGTTTQLRIGVIHNNASLWNPVQIAPGASGRMWVAWAANQQMHVALTNTSVTAVYKTWHFNSPGGFRPSKFAISPSGTSIDMIASIGASDGSYNLWHKRLTP